MQIKYQWSTKLLLFDFKDLTIKNTSTFEYFSQIFKATCEVAPWTRRTVSSHHSKLQKARLPVPRLNEAGANDLNFTKVAFLRLQEVIPTPKSSTPGRRGSSP